MKKRLIFCQDKDIFAFPAAPADGMGSDPFSIPSSMNIPQPPAIPPLPPTQPPTDDDIQRRFNNL